MTSAALSPRVVEWRQRFGDHLRAQRVERGLSQEGLAERAGVDRKLIYRTELGQTSPRLDAVVQIAEALGMPVTELVDLPRRPRRRAREGHRDEQR